MRLFFALQPSPGTCMGIADWRDRVLPPLDRPVPAANFHITLAFLGNVAEDRLESLARTVDDISASRITICLDELGYWSKPRILWLGTERVPNELTDLVGRVTSGTRASGIQLEKTRRYQPHVTLARNCRTPPPASIEQPAFDLTFDRFFLFESVSVKGGVRYDPIADWTL